MSSWFHRLRRKRVPGAIASAAAAAVADEPPAAPPCSPNRASYYVPSRDRDRIAAAPHRRAAAGPSEDNPKLRDTRFPRSPQPTSDIVFDVVSRRDDGHRLSAAVAAPELKLRPILTKPPPRSDVCGGGGSSAAASPTGRARPPPRFHAANKSVAAPPDHRHTRSRSHQRRRWRGGGGGSRGLRWVWESVVVVKESADPEEDFLESMAEMVAAANNAGGGGARSPLPSPCRQLEDLLACYLALNAADHHRAIVAAFRRAWVQLHLHHRAPPPQTPSPLAAMERRRCFHERECEREPCVAVFVDR